MRKSSADLSPQEAKNLREFITYAANHWANGQEELAEKCEISQATINMLMHGNRGPGMKSLRAIESATGIKIDQILSGIGLERLKQTQPLTRAQESISERDKAAQMLSELLRVPLSEVNEALDEVGIVLPGGAGAMAWFDIGRAAIERKRAGIALARHISSL